VEAKKAVDPAAAAGLLALLRPAYDLLMSLCLAAAAARINASIQAKRGVQHVDVPPIQSVWSPFL
jgi:hypothetical protein